MAQATESARGLRAEVEACWRKTARPRSAGSVLPEEDDTPAKDEDPGGQLGPRGIDSLFGAESTKPLNVRRTATVAMRVRPRPDLRSPLPAR